MKRRHSPSPPAPAARRIPSSYAASAAFPPDKPLGLDIGLGHPSSLPPSSLPPSTLSSPHRFAYRDPTGSDTESDSGASDDEIEMSLASIPRWAADVSGSSGVMDQPVDRKGKAVDPRERGGPSGLDVARERAARRHAASKLRGDLGRRSRSRVPSSVRVMGGRVVSPTESIYIMTQGMSSLQTSPPAITEESDEQIVSSALETDRRSSSPSPVPQSPSESESPTVNRKRRPTSRLALGKAKKRRDETARPSSSASAAWDDHEHVVDLEKLQMMAARVGMKLSPMSPRSRAAAGYEPAEEERGVDADIEDAGPSHKRVRESDDEPESPMTPRIVERMVTPKRKHVRVETPPAQVNSSATPKTPAPRAPSEELHTPKARKTLRTVLARTPSTPLPPSSPNFIPPGSEDVIEDAVLATASEDESPEPAEEPTPTKPKRKVSRVRLMLKTTESARQRYAQAVPKANRIPVPRRVKHQAAPSRQRGRDTRQLHRSSPTSLLPARERRVPRLRLARRPVALQRPRRPLFWVTEDDEACAVSGAAFTRALRSRQATERARRALLHRYRQRSSYSTLSLSLSISTPTPTHKRRISDPPDADDLAVDELLHDVEMRDSEAVEAVDIALNAQLAGRKRPALPLDAGAARSAQRSALRRREVEEHEEAMRSRAVSRQHELSPADADERKVARAERHLAARNAAEARREEEAEADVDNALVAPEADIEVAVVREEVPVMSEAVPTASVVREDEVAVINQSASHPAPVEAAQTDAQPRSSEVVEDLLSFDIQPVQALNEHSQPAFTDAPAVAIQRSVDAVEDLAPDAEETAASVSTQRQPTRSNPYAPLQRRQRRRHPDQIDAPRLGLARRIISFERRRATTAPPERRPEGGPSRSSGSTTPVPDSPTPARNDLPLVPASSPGPSSSGPSTGPSTDSAPGAAVLSPPPRYEFPFYPVIRAAPRALPPRRAPSPSPSPSARARASSDPPHYAPNRYTRSSPSPPPPYNAMTDCSTVVPPVFLPEPARPGLGLGLDFGPGPAPNRGRGDDGSVSSDDEVLAPGTWPRERRQWRPNPAPYRPAAQPQHQRQVGDWEEAADVEMDEEDDERPGRIAALGRWLGIWR